MNLIYELKNAAYIYPGGRPALQDINIDIFAGERLMLLGPNGCGKSTLQKLLAGLVFASSGRVTAFGRPITAKAMLDKRFAAAFRQKVGFVFQNSDVQLFCPSVLEEIMFGPLTMGMDSSKAKRRADELLEYAGITFLADCSPHHLSGGEKKKVAIAAILAVNPEVLIFDEPTNGLDPRSQCWIVETLNELSRQGKTIILATHQLEAASRLADRVLVLGEDHRFIADDLPEKILAKRELLYKANLIAEI
ncbi:MAG: energy-coupling factor ABC transporter ATP-binding protein [Pelosinus sp.]|nr:energy-coupling factor ABC transporter ATP-binding protein [Pelosinus sp.]